MESADRIQSARLGLEEYGWYKVSSHCTCMREAHR